MPPTASRDSVVFVAITASISCAASRRAIARTAASVRSGAILTASGTYLPCFSASVRCSRLSTDSSAASASSPCRSRKPFVFGEEMLTVT